jgi:carbonic anhydrase
MARRTPVYDELLAANAAFTKDFDLGGLPGKPVRRFVVVSCMDARLDPIAALGIQPGDAHVLRNAGAVVTDDVIRSLVVSHWLLGTQEAFVIGHTQCGMQKFVNEDLRGRLADEAGVDASDVDFHPFADLDDSVRSGVARIRESPMLPVTFDASGLVYDVATGRLRPVTWTR